jgi:hypothetical protein
LLGYYFLRIVAFYLGLASVANVPFILLLIFSNNLL